MGARFAYVTHICRTSKLQVSARAVFFSELLAEGVGDRGIPESEKGRRVPHVRQKKRQRDRMKEQTIGAERKRKVWKERAREIERERERERIVSPWVAVPRSTGTHVESAKRSRSCVKCLDITVLFRLVRSSAALSLLQFYPFYPSARSRAARSHAQPFLSLFSRSRARSCGFDDPSCSISWSFNRPRLIKTWRSYGSLRSYVRQLRSTETSWLTDCDCLSNASTRFYASHWTNSL